MRIERIGGVLAALALAGCAKEGPPALIGTLEWDRIAVTAELAEPVMRWAVAEGDKVEAGAVLLELDPRRQDARIAEARGNLAMRRREARRAHAWRAHRDDRRRAREPRERARGRDRRRGRIHARRRAAQARARRAVAAGPGARDAQSAARGHARARSAAARAHARHAAGADRAGGGRGRRRAARR